MWRRSGDFRRICPVKAERIQILSHSECCCLLERKWEHLDPQRPCTQKHNPALRRKDMAEVETNRLQRRTDSMNIQCDWTKPDWSEWPYLELCSRKWETHTHTVCTFECACRRGRGLRTSVCVSADERKREREIWSSYELCRLQSRVQSFSWPCSFFSPLPLIYISQ